jgi:hypothetical protein
VHAIRPGDEVGVRVLLERMDHLTTDTQRAASFQRHDLEVFRDQITREVAAIREHGRTELAEFREEAGRGLSEVSRIVREGLQAVAARIPEGHPGPDPAELEAAVRRAVARTLHASAKRQEEILERRLAALRDQLDVLAPEDEAEPIEELDLGLDRLAGDLDAIEAE